MAYVDRDDLVRNLDKFAPEHYSALINMLIMKQPAADVAEVKRGEWTKVDVMGNGYGQIYYQHKECPVSSTELFACPYEYCPRCGAKMDGGKEE
jgi:hypothetical protein